MLDNGHIPVGVPPLFDLACCRTIREILHFKELGDTESVVTNVVCVFIESLTISCTCMYLQMH